MHRVLGIFQEPFPLEDNRRIQFIHSVIISLVVVALLFYFKPFDLDTVQLPVVKLIPLYAGYWIACMVICFIADRLIRPAFPSFFDDQTWTVAKHITWTIFTIMLISIGVIFFGRLLGITGISGTWLLNFEVNVFLYTVLPVTMITIIRQVYLMSVNKKEAGMMNGLLSNPILPPAQNTPLIFVSDDGKDAIKLQADQFLFAESADNYTDIVYTETGIVRRALIRSSLKKIEEMNTADFVIRVHRAFLVNMRKVKHITGNAQGFRLIVENIDETIPVPHRNAGWITEVLSHIYAK
jgi:hypothetical protein